LKDLLQKKNQHKEGVTFKIKEDPRITRMGQMAAQISLTNCHNFTTCSSAICRSSGHGPPVPREVANTPLSIGGDWQLNPASLAFGKSAAAVRSIFQASSSSMLTTSKGRVF